MMIRAVGLVLLVAGVMLVFFGLNEMNSLTSDISRMFTGNPTNRSIWLVFGGAVLAVLGMVGMVPGWRKS